jgi:uncharacterized protein YndB with AHSA1/START domain
MTTNHDDSKEIKLVRIYDAPVQAVWDAWTDPAQAAQWWGPRGFTITHHSKDLRPGGHWSYTMHGPDGTDWPNVTKYLEVEPLKKLVYDHGGNDDTPPLFQVEVLFNEVGGKTRMDMTMRLATAEEARQTRQRIKLHNGNTTWDRLAEYLGKHVAGSDSFVINRSFDAPIETVFEMWVKPEHFSRWLAPTGMQMQFMRDEIKVGATTFYRMDGNGMTMYGRAHYEEITPPTRLVYTQQFCDEHENLARHPMAPTWPATMRSVVDFNAEGPDITRVTVTWQVVGDATAEEMATFIGARAGMTQGWSGSFQKLDALLAEQAPATAAA